MNLQQVSGDLKVIDLARKWTLDMRKCAFETRCDFFTMDQIVRAATSVHLNLVEGSHSIYPGIAAQTFSTARASLASSVRVKG
jgi:four helix bundle protein